jgi:hypothetical protein
MGPDDVQAGKPGIEVFCFAIKIRGKAVTSKRCKISHKITDPSHNIVRNSRHGRR